MTFVFVRGDEVLLAARPEVGPGVVVDVLVSAGEPQYRVRFAAGAQIYSARHLTLAASGDADSEDPIVRLQRGELGDAEAFRAFMVLAKLKTPLANNLYSFAASRTDRLPHQFKAVLKLLANPHGRLLIADEVGPPSFRSTRHARAGRLVAGGELVLHRRSTPSATTASWRMRTPASVWIAVRAPARSDPEAHLR